MKKNISYLIAILIGALFCLIVTTHAVFAQPFTPGLVAYYPFDGDANDHSGNGNHGTISGGVTFAAGKFGQAASFDGTTGSISVPDTVSLRLSTFTLAAWILPTSIVGGNRIVEKGSSNSYWLDVNSSARPLVGFYDGAYHDLLGPVITINAWHLVAGTYDGSVLRLYVDGALVNSVTLASKPAQTTQPLVIGWKFGGIASDHLAGLIDELQIYNRALSASEIKTIFMQSISESALSQRLFGKLVTSSQRYLDICPCVVGTTVICKCYSWGGLHQGIDYPAGLGSLIKSPIRQTGKVMSIDKNGIGRVSVVYTDSKATQQQYQCKEYTKGITVNYLHMQNIKVTNGQVITYSTPIGEVDTKGPASGPHLHFEIRRGQRDSATGCSSCTYDSKTNTCTVGGTCSVCNGSNKTGDITINPLLYID